VKSYNVALYRNPGRDLVKQRWPLYFLPANESFATVPGLERELRARVDVACPRGILFPHEKRAARTRGRRPAKETMNALADLGERMGVRPLALADGDALGPACSSARIVRIVHVESNRAVSIEEGNRWP
jgi:hypothetical protein